MKKYFAVFCALVLVFALGGTARAMTLDVYDWNSATNSGTILGQIDTIATAQTGQAHYSFSSASGHPSGVNLAYYNSSFWVHENTNTNELTFGFIFAIDNGPNDPNYTDLWFRIVGSGSDVYVSQSDDPGEAVETSPGWFHGDYYYNMNTDGIAVSGITGTDWTIMVDAVDFGDIQNWYAASGATTAYTDDLALTLGHEYRIVPTGNDPSDEPVNPNVPLPGAAWLLGSGLIGLVGLRRRFRS